MLGWSSQLGNRLFGPDPKLEFRKPGQGLDLLAGPNIPIDAPYWNQYLAVFDSPADVPHLLPAHALIHALHSNPLNVLTLVHFTCSTLFRLLSTPSFPTTPEHAREALNAVRVMTRVVPLLLAPKGVDAQGREVADAVEEELFWRRERVPPAHDIGAEPVNSSKEPDARGMEEGQFVLEDDDEDDAAPSDPLSSSSAASTSAACPTEEAAFDELPPLAERLLGALVDLLFVPGFTIAEALAPRQRRGEQSESVVTYAIWEPGIASSTPSVPLPTSHLNARTEILRLLTLLISLPSLLTPPGLFPTLPNRWRDALVSGAAAGRGDRNVVLCLLCSTLNTALNAGASASSEAGSAETLRARAARLAAETARRTGAAAPSTAAAALGGDEASARHALVGTSLHLLGAVLLEHAPPSAPDGTNLFAFYLAKLHRPTDLSFLISGTLGILEAALVAPPVPASGGLLPNVAAAVSGSGDARRDPAWATEALVLLSRALALNKKLVAHVSRDTAGVPRLLGTLEACALEWREDDAALGVVRAASFALQMLSAEIASAAGASGLMATREELARVLAAPMDVERVGARLAAVVRRQVSAQGVELAIDREGKDEDRDVSCAEFLAVSLHAVLLPSPHIAPHAPSRAALSTIYASRLLLLSNLSPFLRDLGHDAAARLVRVWLAFSAPSWVMMEEGNPRLMYYLLETFNNVVNFHLDSNPHLLYALTITLKRFELLSNFTLAQGIAEARRLRAARRERQAGRLSSISETGRASAESAPAPLASVAAGTDEPDGVSERAKGKRPERERALSISSTVADLSLASPGLGSGAGSSRTSLALFEEDGSAGDRPFVGRNGFVPTEEWVASWRDGLPLDTLLVLLSELRPLLAAHDPSFPSTSAPPSPATIAHLRTLLLSPSLTALLPPSPSQPAPKTRPFVSSPASTTWLASLLYGRLYLAVLPSVRDTLPVQLFAVASAPSASGASGTRAGLVAGLRDGLGAEMELVGRSAAQVGGKVGGAVREVLGRFGGGGGGAPGAR